MAGLGETCTHVAALLFGIESIVKIRDSKTVTEDKAYWLLPTPLKNIKYREVRKMDFTSAKSKKKRLDVAIQSSCTASSSSDISTSSNSTSSNSTSTTFTSSTSSSLSTPIPANKKKRKKAIPETTEEEATTFLQGLYDSGQKSANCQLRHETKDKK